MVYDLTWVLVFLDGESMEKMFRNRAVIRRGKVKILAVGPWFFGWRIRIQMTTIEIGFSFLGRRISGKDDQQQSGN